MRLVLAAIAWTLLCVAVARPQQLGEALQPPQEARELLLALDLSGSMADEDMVLGGRPVDRLTAAKAVLADFLDRREGDRVGVAVPHQQLFRVGANRVQKLPDGVSYEDGAWLSLSNTTQLAVRRAELAMGETVGVVGLCMLGQLIVQYLWVCGARQIFAIDPVPGRAARALTRGATHALTMDATQARAEIEKLTLGRMLDAVFDVTGHPSALAPSTELLRKLGRVVLVGDTPTPSQQHLGPRVLSRSLAILAIHASMNPSEASPFNPWTGEETRALFMDYIVQGRMTVADLTTRRCSPADAPAVYADLLTDRSRDLGVIFDWSLLS